MISQIGVEPESLGKITVQGCKRGWYLSDPGLKGRFRIKLVPIRKEGNSSEAALALVIMIRWGTLGARDQYSHGIVTADLPASLLDHAEKALVNTKTSTPPKGLSLADFFFFTGKPKTGQADKNLPIKIRYSIRNSLRLGRQTKLVVLEAGNQLKWIALELKRIKEVHLHVVHPNEIKWINQSSAKTDKIDARSWPELARGDMLPRKVHIVEGTCGSCGS